MLRKNLEGFLITYMTIIKSKDEFLKICPDQESYTAIRRFTNQLLVICLNLDQFFLLLTLLDIILQNFWYLFSGQEKLGACSCCMLCTYHVPEGASRRVKYCVHKIFISSYLYLCYIFRSSTDKDKQ